MKITKANPLQLALAELGRCAKCRGRLNDIGSDPTLGRWRQCGGCGAVWVLDTKPESVPPSDHG